MAENPRTDSFLNPKDHRIGIYIKWPYLVAFTVLALTPVAMAWAQYFLMGLPSLPESPKVIPESLNDPIGFPVWLRINHFVNFFLMVLLVRSGLSILVDHPRLYWNDHCTLGSEWIRFTPIVVPKDSVWTAKQDSRYLSPWIGLPGFRHTVGIARIWHFLSAFFWLGNGLIFVGLLFFTNQWKRLVPVDFQIFLDAWSVQVHYATFHLPVEPNGFYKYNPLQQLSYFGVVFAIAPITFLTGIAMSPAIDNRFKWYPYLFGGRQCARSIHFLALLGYLGFLVPHVTMVIITGFAQNMNHIVFGTDDTNPMGMIVGLSAIALTAAFCVFANWFSWTNPRWLQLASRTILGFFKRLFGNKMESVVQYKKENISPYFWPNGNLPICDEWKNLSANNFKDYRLKVFGLVENPIELSLEDMAKIAKQDQVTMHHCIQGWSGIAHWGGVPVHKIIEMVRPHKDVKTVVFHSYGEGLHGGEYYDTLTLYNAQHDLTLLAFEMNYEKLPLIYGAPLRLRAENQLGFKMVKWIKSIEFVTSEKVVGKGFGGKNEDDEYYPMLANI